MHPYLLHHDEIRPVQDHVIAPGQVGFLNGWGVFTTIRVYDGTMFAWERHWARISRDARKMHVPIPEDPAWLEAQLHKLIEANRANEATLRVAIVRNKGGMFEGPNIERDFTVVAFTRDVAEWGDSVKLGIVTQARHAANEFESSSHGLRISPGTNRRTAGDWTRWCCSTNAMKSASARLRISLPYSEIMYSRRN
jgi:branched-subunit amino acid aminotransferase/4-amino-4-deoxychorismate lyase